MSNMSKCCNCYIQKSDLRRYNSKFLGANESDALLYCDFCYKTIEANEDQLIKMSVENGDNLSALIKQEHIKDYIDPTSSKCLIQLMKIHKTINEFEGVKKEFVVIELEEYRRYMTYIACSNKKLIDDQKLERIKQKEKEQIELEARRIAEIEAKELRDRHKEEKRELTIKHQIEMNKRNNERIKEKKQELIDLYKDVECPEKKPKKCDFCKEWRMFPFHFKDDNGNLYLKAYTKDKQGCKANCCMDCFHKAEEKKMELAEKRREFCPTCNCYFNCITDEIVTQHLKSKKHIQNLEYSKKDDKLHKLSTKTIKELQAICNKSLNTTGTHLIPNFTRLKKAELIEKMNAVYDDLTFD